MNDDIGWQEDGSYVPCDLCGWEPPLPSRNEPPGVAVSAMPKATTHYGDCPTVPRIDRETRARLIEMDRVRRRGAAEARNFWIG